MVGEKEQQGRRVIFEHPLPVHMMAIDGTWRRTCSLKDVSQRGARLQIQASIEGLTLSEFFLLLSSTGLAYRRCQLVRVNGEELEVRFIRHNNKTKGETGPSDLKR
jgi:PilZ domain